LVSQVLLGLLVPQALLASKVLLGLLVAGAVVLVLLVPKEPQVRKGPLVLLGVVPERLDLQVRKDLKVVPV
jgi:hypothetical protein